MLFAKLHYTAELCFRIAAGHIGYGVKSYPVKLVKEKLKIIIFEFLCFFVARYGIAHVSEICICEYRSASRAYLLQFKYIGTFIGGGNIEFFNHIAFQRTENVVFIIIRSLSSGKYLFFYFRRDIELHFFFKEVDDFFRLVEARRYFF